MEAITENTTRNELKQILKEEISKVTLQELYDLSTKFKEDTKYLPREYKKLYIESVLKVIINRFTSLKNTEVDYEGTLTKTESDEIIELLKKTDSTIRDTLNIIVVYATYLEREPIHLPGTTFPGMVSISTDGENYYCPVKKFHIKNDKAVCKYCIAKEDL